jgi:gliding motility-associated-like protein
MIKKISLLFALWTFVPHFASSQFDFEFWMPPLWEVPNSAANQPSSLFISTPSDTPVTVNVRTTDGTTFNFTGTCTSTSPLIVPLTTTLGQTGIAGEANRNRGLVITSTSPVQCVHRVAASNNQSLVTLKGRNGRGRDFYCASQVRLLNSTYYTNEFHFISVMAIENNTQVTFNTPFIMHGNSGALSNPHTVTLQAGESYLIRSNSPAQHVTGSRVTSNRDIVCISGSTHTRINGAAVSGLPSAADAGTDQLVPIELTGTEWALIKGNNIGDYDYAIFVAAENNTSLFIDGSATPIVTLNAGQFFDWTMTGSFGTPHYFRASRPAYMYHVSGCSQRDEVDMSIMPEISCTGSRYIEFDRFNQPGLQEICQILIPASADATLTFNGVPYASVPGVIINPVPGLSGWKSATFPNSSVPNNLVLRSQGFFHVGWLTGNSVTGAYGYLSGFNDAFEFLNPTTLLPTNIYNLGPICQGQSIDHCVKVFSCGSQNRIFSFSGNDGNIVVAPPSSPRDTCFRYTAPFNFVGRDTVRFVFRNEFNFEGVLNIVFTVVNPNTPINAGPDQQLCTVSTTTLSAVNPDPLATGFWTVAQGTGVLVSPNSPTTVVNNLSLGPNSFIWNQTYPCANRVDLVQVFRFSGTPPVANAGPDALLCSGGNATYTMQANNPGTTATGTWEITGGNATIANINANNAVVSNLGIGVNTFRWNISNGPCAGGDTSDEMIIFVYNANHPAANTSPDQTVCQGSFSSLPISATVAQVPATGQWSVVQGTATFANANAASTTVSGLSIGVNRLRWTINNGPCGTLTDDLIITVFSPTSPNANAGPDQTICLPNNSATLAGNTPTSPATGTWSVVQGTGSFSNINTPNATVSGLSLGVNRFRWTSNNGPCTNGITTDDVIITVFPELQPTANAGPDQSLCFTGAALTATLSGNNPIEPGTGQWTLVNGTGTILNAGNATTTVSGLSIGTNTLQWTLGNGACSGGSSDQIVITVFNASAPAANAGPDAALCTPTTSYTMQGNAFPAPASGQWSLISGSGTITTPTSPTTTITNLGVGANTFRWTRLNGPCTNTSFDDVVITVFANNAAVANAGPDQEFCFSATTPVNTTMTGNTPTVPSTGTWTLLSGGGTIVTPSSPTSAINTLPIGTNAFRWVINNGSCGSTTDDVIIRVFNPNQTPANAGLDQSICSSATAINLTANALLTPATGQWSVVSGSGTFGSPTSSTTTVAGLSVGQNVFRWTINNGPCTSPSVLQDDVVVTVFSALQPAANAGPDQSICNTTTVVNLNGTTPIFPATGAWTLTTGTGTFAIANSPVSTVSGMSVGSNTYTWTINNGPCGANTSDAMVVTVFDVNAPAANAGADQELCLPITSATLAANSAVSPGTGLWSIVTGTATITNPSSPTTTITGLAVGSVTLRWTINNGACNQITTDEVTITLFNNSLAAPNAGPDASLCTPQSTYTMQGNTISLPAQGTWTLVSGTGTIANPNNSTTAISGLGIGANTFRWSLSNGACNNGLFDDMTIFVFDQNQPQANAGPDQNLCSITGDAISANLNGSSLVFPGTGTWTIVQGTGSIVSPNSPSTVVTGLSVGENIFRWTVSNGPCAPPTTFDLVSIFVFNGAAAPANAGADQQLCSSNPSTSLSANNAQFPSIGAWSVVPGSATIVSSNNPNSLVSALGTGVNVLQWTINNGPCVPTITSDQVVITVFDANQPPANAGADLSICSSQGSVSLAGTSLSAPATATWAVISGGGSLSVTNAASTVASSLSIGDNIFSYTISNGPCNAPTTDQIVVTVFSADQTNSNAGLDQNLCTPNTFTTLVGNALIPPATGQWTLESGIGTFASPSNAITAVTGLGVGANVIRWTINNGPCVPSQTVDEVSVFVFDNNQPAANAGPDQSFCEPVSSTTLEGNAPIFPATGQWTVISGTGTFLNPTNTTTQVTGLSQGENVFRWTVSNGPCAPSQTFDDVSIFIFDSDQSPASAGADQILCSPTFNTTLTGNAPVFPATGQWTLVSGTGSIANASNASAAITGLAVGDNIFRWTISNGPCLNSTTTDEVRIRVFDSDAPAADAGNDVEICTPQNSVTMTANAAIFPGQGTWTLVSGSGTILSANDPNSVINNLGIGPNIYRWTIDNNTCGFGITQDEVVITVFNQASPNADAGNDQNLCTPVTSTVLQGNSPLAPATGVWTLISGSGTIVDPANPNSPVNGLSIGPNVFEWTLSNGPCANGITSDQVTIALFDGGADAPFAGPDQELCSPTSTAQLAANAAVFPGIGTWSFVQGTGVFADENDEATTVSGLSIGVNILRWSVNYATCGSPSDDVVITIFNSAQGASVAGPDQELCTPTTSTTMAADPVLSPGIGTWSVVAGSGAFTNNNDPVSAVSNLSVGDNIFIWTIANGPCLDEAFTRDTVIVKLFDENNAVSNAGFDQELCSTTTTSTLTGSVLIYPATGQWTLVQGSGSIINDNQSTTQVTGLQVGENIFRWTVSNGPCPDGITEDVVSIFVYPESQADASAGDDQFLCTPQLSTSLEGNDLTFPASGTWTLLSGTGNFIDVSSPNTVVNGLSVGENIVQWTINNGPCTNGITTDIVSIFVFDQNNADAAAGDDQELCLPVTSTLLSASSYTFPATGTWSVFSGGGNFSNPNDPSASVSDLPLGINILVWTVDNGPCPNGITTDTVEVRVFNDAAAPAFAGDDQELCTPVSSTLLEALTPEIPGIGEWSIISGAAGVAITDVNNPTATVTGLQVGETVLRWTVYNGPCVVSNTFDDVSIFIFDENQPDANAGANQNICTPQTAVTMTANSVTFPATGQWTLVQGQGVIENASDPNTIISGLGIGTNIFQWTIDNGPCANGITTSDVEVNVFDNGQPIANAGIDQEFCLPTTSTTLIGSALVGAATGQWALIAGTGTLESPNTSQTQVTDLSQGFNRFVWTVDNGTCGITSDTTEIRIYNNDAPEADSGPDASLCTPASTYTMQANTPEIPGVGTWEIVTGPNFTSTGTISDINDPQAEISGLVIGENVFAWTIYNGPCELPTADTISVFVFDENQPDANAGVDIEICLPVNEVTMAANRPVFPATGLWTQVAGSPANITLASDSATTITSLQQGTNLFVWNLNNGACDGALTADTVVVRVFGDADAPFAGADQEWCWPVNSTVMTATAPEDPRFGTWTLIAGSGTIADLNDPNTAITDLAIGENCFLWTVYNGPCGEPSVDIVCIYIYDNEQLPASAGPDQLVCTPNTETQLAANSVTFPAIGTWTVANGEGFTGSGVLTDINDPNAVVSGLTIGFNAFVWTIDNGVCANAITSDTIVVSLFNNELEPADAGDDQLLCLPQTSTTVNGSFINGAAVGTWTAVSGVGTIVSPSTATTLIQDLPAGIHLFAWTVDNGPCGISSDTLIVQVNDPSAASADAGPDAEYCTPVSTHFMNANEPLFPAIGTWTRLTGSGQITDPNDRSTEIFNLTTGENIFLWCIDNGACGAVTCDVMSIFIFNETTPDADAGEDIELCLPITETNMVASAAEFPAIGTWQVIQEPVFGGTLISDVNSPTSLMSGLSVGTTILTWTVDNGPCPNGITADTVAIRVFDPNVADPFAGEDQEVCTPFTTVTMNGSNPQDPNYGFWTLIQGSGSITDTESPSTQVVDLAVGINVLTWTYYNGNCVGDLPTDTVVVKVFDQSQPAANAGDDQELCLPQNATLFEGNSLIEPATGSWELVSGFGIIEDPTSPNSAVSNLSVGTNVFVWTISNGPCENAVTSDTVEIRVFDPGITDAFAGNDVAICTPQSCVDLEANPLPNPQVGTWNYVSAVNGSGPIPFGGIADINNPNTEVCGLVVGVHTLQWGIYNGPCNNGNLDQVTISVFDFTAPAANAGEDIELCAPVESTNLAGNAAVFPGVGTWEIISGTATIAEPNNPTSALTDLEVGIVRLTWTLFNGPCAPPTIDTLEVRIYDPNSPNATAGPDAEYCVNFATHTMQGNAPIFPAVGNWSVISGAGDIENPNDPLTQVINIPLNENIFVWSIYNGACPNSFTSDTVSIYVNDASVAAADAGEDLSFCGAPDSLLLSGSVTVGLATGQWSIIDGDGTFTDPGLNTSFLIGFGNGVHEYLWTVDNGACGITTDTLTLTVYDPEAAISNAGESQDICEDDFVLFNLNANEVEPPATAYWSIVEGPIEISDSLSADAGVLTLGPQLPEFGSVQSIIAWTVNNGVCGSTTDTLTISMRDCITIKIPDAFSPNGDGTNDFFVIPNIENYPQGSLKIFNRWGTQIFEAAPYRSDWDGTSHHPASLGEQLPVSTYYYILDLGTGEEAFTGFVYLKR